MTDTVFRSKEEVVEAKQPELKESHPALSDTTHIETPYLDSPDFLDKYFGIGEEWKDHDSAMYPELQKIDEYIASKIRNGEVANTQESVKNLLKGVEKLTDLKKESRSVVRLEVVANYIEFLMKNDNLKSNLKRYAH